MQLLRRKYVHNLTLVLAALAASAATPLSLGGGACIFLLGMGMHVWSKGVLTRDHDLCRVGPYALCRHPFYLGNALLDLGLCVMSGNALLLAALPLLFCLAYVPTIRREEVFLRSTYGKRHEAYCARTPCIVPSVRGFLRSPRAQFSWGKLLAERQVSRVARHLSFPLVLVVAAVAWHTPEALASVPVLAMGGLILGLPWFSAVLYAGLERRKRGGKHGRWALRLARWGSLVCSALLFLALLLWEPEGQDVLLAAGFALPLNALLLVAGGRMRRGLLVRAAQVLLLLLAGLVMQLVWLVPLALVLIAAEATVAGPLRRRFRTAPLWRVATVAAAVIGGAVLVEHAGGLDLVRGVRSIERSLMAVARPSDAVYVLADWDLKGLRVGNGSTIRDKDLGGVLRQARGARVVLVAEADDVRWLLSAGDVRARIHKVVRIGTEDFYVMTLQPQMAAGGAGPLRSLAYLAPAGHRQTRRLA